MFDVFLRLEAVFVGGVGDGVDEAVGCHVAVAAADLDGLVVLADLLQRPLLLTRGSVTCLEAAEAETDTRLIFVDLSRRGNSSSWGS